MNKRRIWVISIAVALLLSAAVAVGVCIFINAPVLSSAHFSVDQKMMSYYTEYKSSEYIEHYTKNYGKEYLETVKLDPDKSLKKQKSVYGDTWYDYFYKQASDALETALVYCEAARAEKTVLSNAEKGKAIEKYTVSGLNVGKYKNTVKAIAEICGLADKYSDKFNGQIACNEENLKKYYEENREQFDCVDYKYIEIEAEYNAENATSAEIAEAMKKAKETAYKLKNSISVNGFDKAVEKYFAEFGKSAEKNAKSVCGYRYETSTQLGNWAFFADRHNGDVAVFEGRAQFSVYCIEKAAYPLDYTLRRVQSVSADASSTDGVYSVYDAFVKMKNTDESFISAAEDRGKTVKTDEVIKEDNVGELIEWLYSAERSIGDSRILKNNGVISLLRYCGDGDSFFAKKCEELYKTSQISQNAKYLKEKYSVKKR